MSTTDLRRRRALIRRLQKALDVKLVRVRKLPSPEKDGWYLHPFFQLAFNPVERKVCYEDTMDYYLPYLPHELVHAVWPDAPESPEEEWECGMISYERAWIERIQPDPRFRKELLEYMADGGPTGEEIKLGALERYEALARAVVAQCGLPDPFTP